MAQKAQILSLLAVAVLGAACSDDGSSSAEPVFPEDYAASYTEVRNCRANGGSHDFNRIRVVASPEAREAYLSRDRPFPIGAVVVKEEYDSSDTDCQGEIRQWSAMQRVAEEADDMLGWRWQQVDFSHSVVAEDNPRCFGCHAGCAPPDGYEGTCTVP